LRFNSNLLHTPLNSEKGNATPGNCIRHPQRILREEPQTSMQLTINKTGITQEVDLCGCVAMYTQDYVLIPQ